MTYYYVCTCKLIGYLYQAEVQFVLHFGVSFKA
jgi:hypothetical protein